MAGVEISKRIILINSVSNVLRRVLNITILLWLHQRLVRNIPAEELKLLPVLMGVIAIAPILVTVLQGGLGRFLTEAYAQRDDRRVTQIVSSMCPFLWAAALLLGVVGGVFLMHIDSVLNILPEHVELARLMFAILLGATILRVIVQPFSMGFYLRQRLLHRDLIGTASELVKMLLLVVLLTQFSDTVLWVVVANVTASTIELGVVVTLSCRLVPALRFRVAEFSRSVLRPVLSFGGWTIMGQLSTLLREMADPIILNNMASATDVVAFNTGSQPDRQMRRSVFSVTATAQPVATAMVATGPSSRVASAWVRMTRYSLWVMLAMTVPIMVFREGFFLWWLGPEKFEEYGDASLVMLLLLARYISISPNAVVGLIAIARAEMHPAAWRALALESSNVLLTLALVGVADMGAVGAALSTLVVHGIGHPLLNWSLGLRLADVSFARWARASILPGLIPAVCALPVWWMLNEVVNPQQILELVLCSAGGFAVYGAALWFCLPPEDRADALASVNGLRDRLPGRGRDSNG